jgi:hypothetical protein
MSSHKKSEKKPMKKMAAGGKVRGGGCATKGLKISKKMG